MSRARLRFLPFGQPPFFLYTIIKTLIHPNLTNTHEWIHVAIRLHGNVWFQVTKVTLRQVQLGCGHEHKQITELFVQLVQ